MSNKDCVIIENLKYNAKINNQIINNLLITSIFHTNFDNASSNDDLKYSINYAVVSRNFKDYENNNKSINYPSFIQLGYSLINDVLLKEHCDAATIKIENTYPNFQTELVLKNDNHADINDELHFKNLSLDAIIGIFTFERFKRQPIKLDIDIETKFNRKLDTYNLETIGNEITKYLQNSNFKTVEALVLNVNKLVFKLLPNTINCDVKVLKTDIIEYADVGVSTFKTNKDIANIGTEIIKFNENDVTIDEFSLPKMGTIDGNFKDGKFHEVYLSFGSNQGNQLSNINEAINQLKNNNEIKVLQTSSLYRSKPMYYLNQPDFINGCLKISTSLSPQELLKYLKFIEYNLLKRVKEFNNGPRSIDLDILLYDEMIINDENLNIPHINMIERTFVLIPLSEILPSTFIHPVTTEPIGDHLIQLLKSESNISIQESNKLISLIPLPNIKDDEKFRYLEYDLINNQTPTQLMSILNITPDSFSDGSKENLNIIKVMEKVDEMVQNNVDIIDIGGCSTRPGSEQPSVEIELSRILPIIKEIKDKYGNEVIISIDTYRSEVAEAAIKLGADIINDISGGTFDNKMYEIIAKYNVPYVINHTRGNIKTMNELNDYSKTEDDEVIILNNEMEVDEDNIVINEISKELSKLLSKMYSKGIKRWQIILDPGLGFAKKLKENLSIIRKLPIMKNYQQLNIKSNEFISFKYLPILLGPSRKKFIGTITKRETANERINGTSASITACIGFGSDIVRVHDFKEMKDVCLMGDAIYKKLI
mgnify:FL=1